MAQPKEFTTQFIINAVLNGGFKNVFTQAQREFIKLGEEIKNLQTIQRDVKAYEKQAEAIQNTTAKLENLRQQIEKIGQQKEFLQKQIQEAQEAGKSTARLQERLAALEQKELVLQQRVDNTSGALEKQNAKLETTRDRLDAAGVSTGDLAAKDAELTGKIEELTEAQKKVIEEAEKYQSAGVQAIEAVGGAIAAAGIAEALGEIKDAYAECVKISAEFGQGMSNVEAIASATGSEMNALAAKAKELGAETKFTARESADAMGYMAMAGWDAQEMLSGMSGVISLAAAAGEDLAQVSDIVTDNLSAFGMQASDTAHFADVLAAAAANSNTNIAIMGETFKSSSSVAGALGYKIEDVAVMVGLMANNAVKGSRAGTALRNIFDGLLGGVTLTAQAFGELDYSAVKYDGSMKGLMETVKDLRGYFDQMTEAEKVNNAQTIAGMRGYNGLLAILNATDEDFQNLYDSINNCAGAAERMAAVKLDNLNGDITLMNSAMEALQTTIGEQFEPELRGLTQLNTELMNGVNDFIKESPVLAKGIMAAGAAFLGVGSAVVGVNSALKVFRMLSAAGLFTTPVGTLLGFAGGVAAVAATITGLNEAVRDGGPAVRELTVAAREMQEAMEEAGASYEDTATEILATANTVDFYIGKLEEIQAAEGKNAAQSQEYQNTLALLLRTMPELSSCISQTTDEYGRAVYTLETTTDALKANTEEWKKNAQVQARQEYLNSLYDQYKEVMLEAAENSVKLTQAQGRLDRAEKGRDATLERMNELTQEAREKGELLGDEYYELEDALYGYNDEIRTAQREIKDLNVAMDEDAGSIATVEEKIGLAEKTWEELLKVLGLYTDEQEDVAEGEQTVQGVLGDTMAEVNKLAEVYKEAYNEAKESFSGQFGLFDEAKADMNATVEAAQKALDSQLKYWQGYAKNVETLKNISAEDLGVTKENYNALMSYVRSGTSEAAGLAENMVKQVKKGNTQALTELANTLGEISKNQDQAAQDVAEWTSGLKEETEKLVQDMAKDIEKLEMSKEAEESARATIQAYIDKANEMVGPVQEAFAAIAKAAADALDNGGGSGGSSGKSSGSSKSSSGSKRSGSGTDYFDSSISSGYHYATGTQNAPPGWAWVGEEGPELMRMRGGEQILPHSVSRQAAKDYREYERYAAAWGVDQAPPNSVSQERETAERNAFSRYTAAQGVQQECPLEVAGGGAGTGGSSTSVSVTFQISGNATPETVQELQGYGEDFAARVLSVIADAKEDARMGAYE